MAKVHDLTGLQFGKLTVLKRDWDYVKEHNIKRPVPYWKCQCSCGYIFSIAGSKLTQTNGVKKCKFCNNKEKIRDLTGKQFNRLTVLKLSENRTNDGGAKWVCKCSCGKIIEVSRGDLVNNHTKSCGCLKIETLIQDDLTGLRFGKLTVIEKVPAPRAVKNRYSYWKCKCDCGGEIITKKPNLINGDTKSCGCLISVGEFKIKQILEKNNITFIQQKIFEDCRFPDTDYCAKFDFYINNSFLLEFDGIQHYYAKGRYSQMQVDLIKKRDLFKNKWCKENNIILKRIPYWKIDSLTLEDIMGEKYII